MRWMSTSFCSRRCAEVVPRFASILDRAAHESDLYTLH
jgi:hypothetical protein